MPGERSFRLYKVLALPCGAVASVAAFLRNIAREGLQVPITSFFDNFTALAVESGAESTNFAVTGLFKLLRKKRVPKVQILLLSFLVLGWWWI